MADNILDSTSGAGAPSTGSPDSSPKTYSGKKKDIFEELNIVRADKTYSGKKKDTIETVLTKVGKEIALKPIRTPVGELETSVQSSNVSFINDGMTKQSVAQKPESFSLSAKKDNAGTVLAQLNTKTETKTEQVIPTTQKEEPKIVPSSSESAVEKPEQQTVSVKKKDGKDANSIWLDIRDGQRPSGKLNLKEFALRQSNSIRNSSKYTEEIRNLKADELYARTIYERAETYKDKSDLARQDYEKYKKIADEANARLKSLGVATKESKSATEKESRVGGKQFESGFKFAKEMYNEQLRQQQENQAVKASLADEDVLRSLARPRRTAETGATLLPTRTQPSGSALQVLLPRREPGIAAAPQVKPGFTLGQVGPKKELPTLGRLDSGRAIAALGSRRQVGVGQQKFVPSRPSLQVGMTSRDMQLRSAMGGIRSQTTTGLVSSRDMQLRSAMGGIRSQTTTGLVSSRDMQLRSAMGGLNRNVQESRSPLERFGLRPNTNPLGTSSLRRETNIMNAMRSYGKTTQSQFSSQERSILRDMRLRTMMGGIHQPFSLGSGITKPLGFVSMSVPTPRTNAMAIMNPQSFRLALIDKTRAMTNAKTLPLGQKPNMPTLLAKEKKQALLLKLPKIVLPKSEQVFRKK